MKPSPFYSSLLLGALGLGASLTAQTPSTPAPSVVMSGGATVSNSAAQPAQPNQVVYSETLPNAQELTDAAASQGLKVIKIDQSANQTIAVYRTNDGQTTTVAYVLLPAASGNAPAPSVATVGNPPPAVIYTPPAVVYTPPATSVYYYENDPYYYAPWYGYAYPSVGVNLRLGYRGGYYRGGYYHGGYYRGGGHWHR